MHSFLSRFGHLIRFVLSGFDRLRFRGESRFLGNERGVDNYLFQQQIKHVDFPAHVPLKKAAFCSATFGSTGFEAVRIKSDRSAIAVFIHTCLIQIVTR